MTGKDLQAEMTDTGRMMKNSNDAETYHSGFMVEASRCEEIARHLGKIRPRSQKRGDGKRRRTVVGWRGLNDEGLK